MAIRHPWNRRDAARKRLHATFLDDPRYAEAGSKVYPVLLTSFCVGRFYEENMSDADEYPTNWAIRFKASLREAGSAVLASDSNSDGEWRFLSIVRVANVQLANHLTCEIGAKVTSLHFE